MRNKSTNYFLTVNNRRYNYRLSLATKATTRVLCDAANIDQEFLNEDVPLLLVDLPTLILAEREHLNGCDTVIRFRVNSEDKRKIEQNANKKGYKNISSYLRDMALNASSHKFS